LTSLENRPDRRALFQRQCNGRSLGDVSKPGALRLREITNEAQAPRYHAILALQLQVYVYVHRTQ